MKFKYHGKYCGPGWNQGKWQDSKKRNKQSPPPIDKLDKICMEHDDAYANGESLRNADLQFYKKARKLGIKGKMAAYAIGLQGILRKPIKRAYPSKILSFPKKSVSIMSKSRGRSKTTRSQSRARKTLATPAKSPKRSPSGARAMSLSKSRIRSTSLATSSLYYKGGVQSGSSGSYRKIRINKRKRTVKNPMDLSRCSSGSVLKTQSCITQNAVDPKTPIYFGHAIARTKIGESVARSLVKLLLNKAQYYYTNWNEPIMGIGNNYNTIWFTYYPLQTNEFATRNLILIPTGATPLTIAIQLYSQFQTLSGSTIYQWQDIGLDYTSSSLPGVYIPMVHFNLNSVNLYIEFASKLKFQNRTRGDGSLGSPDPNVGEEGYIADNPLEGILYTSKVQLNGFQEKARATVISAAAEPNTRNGLIASYDSGIIAEAVVNPNSEIQGLGNAWAKPPPAWSIGAKSKPLMCQPSEHIENLLKYKKKCTFMYFTQRWFKAIQGTDSTKFYFQMGPASLFALEKVIATGELTPSENALAKVSIEVEQSYGCTATVKNHKKTVPINTQ